MEIWQAHYQDSCHNLDCSIENLSQDSQAENVWRMCINGIAFYGIGLDDWELSVDELGCDMEHVKQKFSLFPYGDKENGYHFLLQNYRLQICIPTVVFSIEKKCNLSAVLTVVMRNMPEPEAMHVKYSLDGNRITPNIDVCERFCLSVEGEEIGFESENPSTLFETSLQSICKQLTGKYYLCNCFGCLYSDYSPYGQSNIGTMFCFEKIKEIYLQVYSKYEGLYTIWDVFDAGGVPCQETAWCEHFAPRIDCLGGYRGTIYTE